MLYGCARIITEKGTEMQALIDGDILRYEIGYAAEIGWKSITGREEAPPWDYVEEMLLKRIASIQAITGASEYKLYITEGRTFRFDVATTKPYKGTRVDKKPWHFRNLTAYMKHVLNCEVVTGIEADDAMGIEHSKGNETIICSRDKDLKQVPGWFYSWEIGKQPSFGPKLIEPIGELALSKDRKTLKGTGYAFFCAQLLMGDRVDNIPGADRVGPVASFDALGSANTADGLLNAVIRKYKEVYGGEWKDKLTEQGRLIWILRKLNEDGSVPLWNIGDVN
jgi:hypothetical protein